MNPLARWNQLRWNQLNEDALDILFRPQANRVAHQEELSSVPKWTPLVGISEDAKEYLIKAELPEVRKEDVKVTNDLSNSRPTQKIENKRTNTMKMQTISSQYKNFPGSPTHFTFQAPATRQVSLVGDFNNWDTSVAPMEKGPDGIWKLSLPLGPGRYEYRFYADGVWQDDPTAQQRVANALGTENCVRIVAA